jgi:hypothetical protein
VQRPRIVVGCSPSHRNILTIGARSTADLFFAQDGQDAGEYGSVLACVKKEDGWKVQWFNITDVDGLVQDATEFGAKSSRQLQ